MSTGKQKIFTLGCSHTYGHGFPDCDDLNIHYKPSKFSWPSQLEKRVDCKVINLSSPGASPKETCRRFLKNVNLMAENDIVIIQWPYLDRTCITINSTLDGIVIFTPGRGKIDPGQDDLLEMDTDVWYKYFYNKCNLLEEFLTSCMLVENTCKLKGIHVMNFMWDSYYKGLYLEAMKDPEYNWFDATIERNVFDCVPRNEQRFNKVFNKHFHDLPDGHRGYNHHKLWALRVHRNIIRKGWLNGA